MTARWQWGGLFIPPVPDDAPLPTCDPNQPDATSPWPHDYEEIGEEYGSLADGGSYTVFRCRRCRRKAFAPLPD